MRSVLALVVVLVCAGSPIAAAQLRLPAPDDRDDLAAVAGDVPRAAPRAGPAAEPGGLRAEDLTLRNTALIAAGSLAVAAYGRAKWWDEGYTGQFRSQNEHWFGEGTRSGGADKLGHTYFSYVATRLLARGFEAVGNEPRASLDLGFWSALGIMSAIEVVDGYSRQYRFSAQDALMNVVGAGLGYVLERNPHLDRLVDLRFLYKTSQNSQFDPAGDYSGQTYLLALKASGVASLRDHPWLRYFELVVGYGTRGYESPPPMERSRNVYVGVSLNLAEVLGRTAFRGSAGGGTAQRATEMFLEYIQIPGTAALSRHRL